MDDVFVDHDLKAAAFWANLMALARPNGLRVEWVGERALRALRRRIEDPQTGRWLPVLPDGYAEITYPNGGIQCSLLEVDMGTLTLARFRTKLRALDLYQCDVGASHPKHFFEVLVLTHSAGRMERLMREGRKVVPEDGWHQCCFATFEALDPAQREGGWQTLDSEACGLLWNDPGPPVPDQAARDQPA